mmetsp:Transcript_20495/g.56827  ORF Transcript_20495/g.56827 Transcript_20495/m.56827 type:complete len:233 (+) Transcript_20495:590-1288(+)
MSLGPSTAPRGPSLTLSRRVRASGRTTSSAKDLGTFVLRRSRATSEAEWESRSCAASGVTSRQPSRLRTAREVMATRCFRPTAVTRGTCSPSGPEQQPRCSSWREVRCTRCRRPSSVMPWQARRQSSLRLPSREKKGRHMSVTGHSDRLSTVRSVRWRASQLTPMSATCSQPVRSSSCKPRRQLGAGSSWGSIMPWLSGADTCGGRQGGQGCLRETMAPTPGTGDSWQRRTG